jgi:hypothetical protein
MNEINKLIKADQTNCQQSYKLFNQFDPLLATSFDDVANLFEAFFRGFGYGATDDDIQHSFSKLAEEAGITESEILDVLKGGKSSSVSNDLFEKIISNRNDYYSRRSRGLLLLQAYRSFMHAGTDIRRLRVVTAIGFMRLEIEAVALMFLIQANSELGFTWLNLRGDIQGKEFFNKTKKDISKFCDRFELTVEWNLASSASQHARFIGLVDGLSISSFSQIDRHTDNFSLALQDFDEKRPEQLISRALYILRTQAKLLLPLQLALPEVSDPLLLETRIPKFTSNIGVLYNNFQKKFPEFLKCIGGEI